jgi:hypothetical protein
MSAVLPIPIQPNGHPASLDPVRQIGAVRDYSVFGGVLRSTLEFPELPLAREGARADWTLTVAKVAPPEALTPVGERRVREEQYRLWRLARGLRLEYSHAGAFDILDEGASIIWYYRDDAVVELVRSIVLGPAIALAFELAGFLCLHGSAVALGDTAVAFVGPKHFGKSTIATALTAAGGRLIGDDLLVVSPCSPVTVRPGVPSVRLWGDVAATLRLSNVCDTLIPGIKNTATGFSEKAVALAPLILSTIYVLAPVMPDGSGKCAWRSHLTPMEAAIALAHQTKLPDSLVGLHAAASQLTACAAVAANVPVSVLHLVRDLTRLDETVRQIMDWSRTE